MTDYLAAVDTRVRCPEHPKKHPLECPCARRMLREHPHVTVPVYLGKLDYVRLTRQGPA